MNIKSLATVALMAAAALAAHAQVVPGDVVVGFRTGTTGNNNLEIDAGNASSLVSTAISDGGTVVLGNFNTALNALSATWTTGTTTATGALNWGAVGTIQAGDGSIQTYASSKWTTAGVFGTQNTTAYSPVSALGTANTKTTSIYSGFNGVNPAATFGTSITIAGSSLSSWAANGGNTGSSFVGQYSNTAFSNLAKPLASQTYAASDLYNLVGLSADGNTPASVNFLGTFSLSNSGVLSFTAAIPEPSTYAAILGVATLGFAALRRRKQALLA